jgi:5-hydroxyisourate hydrolase
MSTLSTHVLDLSLGRPAEGVRVVLETTEGAQAGAGITDSDGRVRDLSADLHAGVYRLRFFAGEYFRRTGRESFYDDVTVSFHVAADPHYHVPLLLSPFGYSTYKGS